MSMNSCIIKVVVILMFAVIFLTSIVVSDRQKSFREYLLNWSN